jgi:hypothetical protein
MKNKIFGVLILFSLWGCSPKVSKVESQTKNTSVSENTNPPITNPPVATSKQPAKVVQVGPGVYLEVEGEKRTVVVNSKVVRREGFLELLLCREKTKEHESILAASVDARDMHQAMLTAGLKTGKPVQFLPEYKPASGIPLDIKLRFKDSSGKDQIVEARDWIKKSMTNLFLEGDWVFAGSKLVTNSNDLKAQPYFLANDGDLISISNFESSLIDVSIKISSANSDLGYEPMTAKIPPVGTPVAVIISQGKNIIK